MSQAAAAADPLRLALVGAPNSGKTTLFNALTGARAHVGNYPGVTVERRWGAVRRAQRDVTVVDLPGTYTLEGHTPDEAIVSRVLQHEIPGEPAPDALLVVVDGTTLRRGLALVAEALHAGRPLALVVTMIDEVRARGGRLDVVKLSNLLGVPVLGVVGHRGVGYEALLDLLQRPESWSRPSTLPDVETPEARFAWVDHICAEVGAERLSEDQRSDRIDRWLLHPLSGGLTFVLVMLLLFQSIFAWAAPAMDAIDGGFAALAEASRAALGEGWWVDLWADGIVAGVGSVLIFLPQIVILFTLIHLLNDIGYMARAAFLIDRVMGWVGLQGRSFVPLLSCHACAVPGIMAARTIESPRERLATILVAPFMSCSARLPVYTLLIAAFVPALAIGPLGLQGLTMLGLYALGTLTALASAALLQSTLLRGRKSVFYMELPPYRLPTFGLLARQVFDSAWAFVRRAGTIILATSIVLWGLLSFPSAEPIPDAPPEVQARADLEASLGARLGRAVEPVIEPLGFDWKIGVGLVASLAAREVIVSTLAQIYAIADPDDFEGLQASLTAPDPVTGRATLDLPSALALLVFFVFALQCMSTIVVMARETGSWRWPAFAFAYMQGLAWLGAFVTYRIALLAT